MKRTPVAERFAENLHRYRKRSGLSQEELGFAAALHRTEIGILESGVRTPRICTLARLCGALGVEPNDLMEGISWNASQMTAGGYEVGVREARDG